MELAFITVSVVDANGLVVPRSGNLINFEIGGSGELVAVGSGNAASHESFQAHHRKVYNGKCLLIVRSKSGVSGKIKITATSEGLTSAKLKITAK
jgi:beta-galactosidase